MKIRGNTVGTPIKPKKVLVKSEILTEDEKAIAREKIGAMKYGEVTLVPFDGEEGGISISAETPEKDDTDYITAGRVGFYSTDDDQQVILSHIHDGIRDDDAATVGQLNEAVGGIETALDSIIEIQESLIGGATA